jgi:hypothetical protein
MNFRHAAALALVGWYLMVPPPQSPPAALATNIDAINAYRRMPQRLPLSQWNMIESFDSDEDCRACELAASKEKEYDFPKRSTKIDMNAVAAGYSHYAGVWGRCIASDDPRLKSN